MLALVESALLELNVKIVLPGHQGIELNEFADLLAKAAAHDIYTGRLSAPSFVTYNDVAKIVADITRKSWQRKWDQDVCGSYTRELIPEVGTKVFFQRSVILEYRTVVCDYMTLCYVMILIVLIQLIVLFVNMVLKENLLNIFCYVVSDFKFQDARNKLIHTVNEIFDLSACKRRSQLSENLLLAPVSVSVTRNEDKDIKAALFQFISETEVKL